MSKKIYTKLKMKIPHDLRRFHQTVDKNDGEALVKSIRTTCDNMSQTTAQLLELRKDSIKFDNFSKKYGGFAIFLLRVNPLTTTDLVSYLAGLSKIKFWKFILWTGLGLVPMIFIQTYFGDVFVKGNGILSALVIILSVLYLIFFVYLILRLFVKKK